MWKCPFGHRGLRLKDIRSLDSDLGILGSKLKNRGEERSHKFSERKKSRAVSRKPRTQLFLSSKQGKKESSIGDTGEVREVGASLGDCSALKSMEANLKRKHLVYNLQ